MTKEKIISLAIICATILIAAFFMMNVDFYIQDASNNLPNNLVSDTISVQGDGEVFATPDILILNIAVEETKDTTELAQTEVNKKINTIQEILESHKIKDGDIKTTNMNVYPDYDYKEKGRELIGYKARHSVQIKIKNANLENDGVGGKLIDSISQIGGVLVNSIDYDIEDKTPYYTEARKLAMEKAKQKAQELAKVAGVSLDKPTSISENINDYYPSPVFKNTYAVEMSADEGMGGGSDISLGELKITINVNVVYGIK
ncbi:MAG TPA: SIMPL domain-containing protein [Candidatus Absconditabacterales bacterium]|nr:SIMPL domain-containing protein [Candidatus Absconditabacterales bacterium]